jgi:hypothetical protein
MEQRWRPPRPASARVCASSTAAEPYCAIPPENADRGRLQSFNLLASNQEVRELCAIAGRRSGKSRIAAALAVFQACFVKHKLAAGEVGHVIVLAASRDQARVVFEYIKGFLEESPVLRQEIESITALEIRLRTTS